MLDDMSNIVRNLDCGRVNWIDLVAEKAIADLRVLASGHTRMALGNTRMRCWYAYGGKPYAYGRKR